MSESTANHTLDIVTTVLVAVAVLLCLAPFIHILSISFSSNRAITSGEVTLFPLQLKLYQMIQNNMVSELTRLEGASGARISPKGLRQRVSFSQRFRFCWFIRGCKDILSAV